MKNAVGSSWQTLAFKALNNRRCQAVIFFASRDSFASAPILAELEMHCVNQL